jgi:hypothetical protein
MKDRFKQQRRKFLEVEPETVSIYSGASAEPIATFTAPEEPKPESHLHTYGYCATTGHKARDCRADQINDPSNPLTRGWSSKEKDRYYATGETP